MRAKRQGMPVDAILFERIALELGISATTAQKVHAESRSEQAKRYGVTRIPRFRVR